MNPSPAPHPQSRLILAGVLAATLGPLAPAPAATQETVTPYAYPRVKGRNLNDEGLVVPDDLPGDHRLLLIPFHQWQQEEANTWLARLPALADSVPGFRYFEQPTLAPGWKLLRWMIDGGMRSGIPDPEARARTITVFVDRSRFLRAARIDDMDHISVFLLDADGRVVWRAGGPVTDGAWESLQAFLRTG